MVDPRQNPVGSRMQSIEGFDENALRKIKRPTAPAFVKGIKGMFVADAKRPWRDFIKDIVRALAKKV